MQSCSSSEGAPRWPASTTRHSKQEHSTLQDTPQGSGCVEARWERKCRSRISNFKHSQLSNPAKTSSRRCTSLHFALHPSCSYVGRPLRRPPRLRHLPRPPPLSPLRRCRPSRSSPQSTLALPWSRCTRLRSRPPQSRAAADHARLPSRSRSCQRCRATADPTAATAFSTDLVATDQTTSRRPSPYRHPPGRATSLACGASPPYQRITSRPTRTTTGQRVALSHGGTGRPRTASALSTIAQGEPIPPPPSIEWRRSVYEKAAAAANETSSLGKHGEFTPVVLACVAAAHSPRVSPRTSPVPMEVEKAKDLISSHAHALDKGALLALKARRMEERAERAKAAREASRRRLRTARSSCAGGCCGAVYAE